ncbi:site-specific integrase [Tumebacillus permanentifrigoris]|uniref:Phage integrase family protein n=1 Tax=Tumebacillus permanentifrigoris TaxID=378543 RepID=A0A316D6X5_9BACL|nr:site-specific integrase [Tumebacillus permanentifrigoris]PWK11474.1 phage integrase family protein [Tumebacillus permanentifrigoris]
MEFVQPIRNSEDIAKMKATLKRQSMRDWFLFVMGINVGLRVSDLLPRTVADVRGRTHIVIREKKTGKEKRFKINTTMQSIVEEYTEGMADTDLLFPSRKGDKPIGREQAYRILNNAAKQCGLEEVGTHTMRKTFGYHHYQRNKDVALLQKLFGHSAPSITLRYIGIEQDEMDASIDDFSL